MSGSSRPAPVVPKSLVVAMFALTIAVMALGAVVVVIQLQPEDAPETKAERDIAIWERRLDENPDSSVALTGYGIALEDAGDVDGARTVFERAIGLNPAEWPALLRLGVIHMESDPGIADDYLERAGAAAPRNAKAPAYIALGDVRFAVGDFDGARRAYEDAVADAPFVFNSHLGLARALEKLGDVSGAIEQYRRAGDFNPSSPEVAEALERLGAANETS